jgi:hypothetical protein
MDGVEAATLGSVFVTADAGDADWLLLPPHAVVSRTQARSASRPVN